MIPPPAGPDESPRKSGEPSVSEGGVVLRWVLAIAAVTVACVGNIILEAKGRGSVLGIVLVAFGGMALLLLFVHVAMRGLAARRRDKGRPPSH
jgi:hypothetical protein